MRKQTPASPLNFQISGPMASEGRTLIGVDTGGLSLLGSHIVLHLDEADELLRRLPGVIANAKLQETAIRAAWAAVEAAQKAAGE